MPAFSSFISVRQRSSAAQNLCRFFLFGVVLLLVACAKPAFQLTEPVPLTLQVLDSVRLSGPVRALVPERDGLLLLDQAGTTIYRLDLELKPQPSLALTARLPAARGMAADPFSIYIYDDNRLFRMDRSTGKADLVSSNIKCQAATVLAGGQVAVIDAHSSRILVFDPAGGVSDLDVLGEAQLPATFAVAENGDYYILDQTRRQLVVLNRVGIRTRKAKLPGPARALALDDSLNAYLLDPSGTRITRLDRRNRTEQVTAEELGLEFVADGIAVIGDALYLLDQGRRVFKFYIPRR